MLWRVRYRHQTSRPEPYRAPSWSWASGEGTIYNHRTNQEAVANTSAVVKILDLEIEHTTEDTFGQVESARVCIQGRLLPIDLEFQTRSPEQLTTTAQLQWQGTTITETGQDLIDLDFEMSASTKPSSAYCMPLVADKYGAEKPETLVSLLLQRVEGTRGVYERFGVCDLQTGIRDALTRAKSVPLSEGEYVDSDEEGVYTIYIS